MENGFCKYGLLNLNGLWKDVPTVESHDNPYFTNHKVLQDWWGGTCIVSLHSITWVLFSNVIMLYVV